MLSSSPEDLVSSTSGLMPYASFKMMLRIGRQNQERWPTFIATRILSLEQTGQQIATEAF